MMSKTDDILQLSRAESFIARSRREGGEPDILCHLAQEASKLANAALERANYSSIRKEQKDDRELAAAIGRIQAVAAIAAARLGLEDKMIAAGRDKLGKAWALEIDPDWRCASDEQI